MRPQISPLNCLVQMNHQSPLNTEMKIKQEVIQNSIQDNNHQKLPLSNNSQMDISRANDIEYVSNDFDDDNIQGRYLIIYIFFIFL